MNKISVIGIDIAGGDVQECDIINGSNVTLAANVEIHDPNDDVASITWYLDDVLAGEGMVVEIFVPQGLHIVKAILETVKSVESEDVAEVSVLDTADPEISAAFIDPKTGETLTDISGNGNIKVKVTASATDACDPSPEISMTVGTSVQVDDTVVINTSRNKPTVEVSGVLGQDSVELKTTA